MWDRSTWNHLTMGKQMSSNNLFENKVTYKLFAYKSHTHFCPVGWSCRIRRMLSCKGVRPSPHSECLEYNTKQSDSEGSVMLELWGMQRIPSLPSLPAPLWPWVVTTDRVLSMGQIEQNCILMLNWIVWNRNVLTFNCM